jgi:hypothetical protein
MCGSTNHHFTVKPKYNEKKTTQAAALLLELNDGWMNYMKLIKLLYNSSREAMKRWARPITYDELYSLDHGQILSKTLDNIKGNRSSKDTYWNTYIQTEGHSVYLLESTGCDELSPAEIELIKEMNEKYQGENQFDMGKEHHNPDIFPEWKNPHGSRIKTDYTTVLNALGFSDEDISIFKDEMRELALLEELA